MNLWILFLVWSKPVACRTGLVEAGGFLLGELRLGLNICMSVYIYIYIYGSVPLIWDQGRFTYAVTTVCGAGAGVGPELVHFVFLWIFK